MQYYLENETFAFSPDKCLFDTKSAALDFLLEDIRFENAEENERILRLTREYNGENAFREVWSIQEVFDWDSRCFGDKEEYLVVREPGFIGLMNWGKLGVLRNFKY